MRRLLQRRPFDAQHQQSYPLNKRRAGHGASVTSAGSAQSPWAKKIRLSKAAITENGQRSAQLARRFRHRRQAINCPTSGQKASPRKRDRLTSALKRPLGAHAAPRSGAPRLSGTEASPPDQTITPDTLSRMVASESCVAPPARTGKVIEGSAAAQQRMTGRRCMFQ